MSVREGGRILSVFLVDICFSCIASPSSVAGCIALGTAMAQKREKDQGALSTAPVAGWDLMTFLNMKILHTGLNKYLSLASFDSEYWDRAFGSPNVSVKPLNRVLAIFLRRFVEYFDSCRREGH